jgi:hypothetical protein
MRIAVTVTKAEPRTKGSVPYRPNVGYQRVLKRLSGGTSTNVGRPSRKRKTKISRTNPMLETPTTRMSASIANSAQRRLALVVSCRIASVDLLVQRDET